MTTLTIIPARGRDYRTDLDACRDFIVQDMSSRWDGKPCNIEDLRRAGVTVARVRYSALVEAAPANPSRRACDASF